MIEVIVIVVGESIVVAEAVGFVAVKMKGRIVVKKEDSSSIIKAEAELLEAV